MAAPMKSHVESSAVNNIATTFQNGGPGTDVPVTSKQLLYSEKFPDRSSDRLKVTKHQDHGCHKTFRIPPSSVLSRVKGFLPQLEASNSDLKGREAEFCIENVESCSGPVIQLDLALVEMNSDIESSDDAETSSNTSDSESEDNVITKVTRTNNCSSNSKTTHRKSELIQVLSTDGHSGSDLAETDQREITPSTQSSIATSNGTPLCSTKKGGSGVVK